MMKTNLRSLFSRVAAIFSRRVSPQQYKTISLHATQDAAANAVSARNQGIQSNGAGQWRVVEPV